MSTLLKFTLIAILLVLFAGGASLTIAGILGMLRRRLPKPQKVETHEIETERHRRAA